MILNDDILWPQSLDIIEFGGNPVNFILKFNFDVEKLKNEFHFEKVTDISLPIDDYLRKKRVNIMYSNFPFIYCSDFDFVTCTHAIQGLKREFAWFRYSCKNIHLYKIGEILDISRL